MNSMTEKLGSILEKGKDKAAGLWEKGGQWGKELLNDGKELGNEALRKGDAMLDSLDKSLDGKPTKPADGQDYSRLILNNQCDRTVRATIMEFKDKPGYNPGEVAAHAQQQIEVWKGTATPQYTYTFQQEAGEQIPASPLARILKDSKKTVTQQQGITYHDYTYTLCKDAPSAPVSL